MPSLGSAVAAIGVFDGVHLGHRHLIGDAVALASRYGVHAVVVTFDRDPEQVVIPDRHVPQLLSLDDKLSLIAEAGASTIVVIPFCLRMAEMSPDRFLDEILLQVVKPRAVAVGHDFRFGVHASGDVELLRRFGHLHGFDVTAHELLEIDGAPVTSTRIRSLIAAGDVTAAAHLLGRPHRVSGRVGHGRGEGARAIGVPTANITPGVHSALPADGVYAGWALLDDARLPAAISVGRAPSFRDARDVLEVHVLDFEGDLYATDLTVEFATRLHDHAAFDDIEELAASIQGDIAHVRRVIGGLT